ncbi:hypothetical protein T069G_09393 [Trichoderma breve]|uniref:Uncharacterized protein n=1 Tax=Trichoderma breve TaxID=2034170 RepID=A0A9W9E3Q0_9HYPO|nr:hypothetical protein T069G_09393 [Trichoderma breve]KAJ4856025.1 hypothetical protein T069G_09393 [Trichoderma breve]
MAPCRPTRASKAKPTSTRSSRARKEKQRRRKAREKRTKAKNLYQQLRNQVSRDLAQLPNGLELELPDEEDFVGISRLPKKKYYSRIAKARKELNKDKKRELPTYLKASKPQVPDPYDDKPQLSYLKRGGYQEQEEEEQEGQEQEVNQEPERDYEPFRFSRKRARKAPPPPEPVTFMDMPREIRMEIYRHLLTAAKPIPVHGGWKQVYWTKDLQISTAILRTCKIVHEEASVVLYGANTFLYRLRDANFNGDYIDNLATDDEPVGRDGDESESEYEDDLEEDDEDDEDGPVEPDRECSINIERYAHLFRHITIEAEANRYSDITQNSMVAAMDVFRKPDQGGPAETSRSIHTLTVCIMPLLHQQEDQPSQKRFTFVDFFLPKSPVIQAIKAVDCQVLHVDILTRHASRRSAQVTVKGTGSCRLTINRRHEQAMNYFQGEAAGDKAVRRRTVEMAKRSVEAIDTLAKHIEEQCNRRHFDQDTTMAMDVDSPDWLNVDQDDEHHDEDIWGGGY